MGARPGRTRSILSLFAWAAALLGSGACASRALPRFDPAGAAEAARVLEIWESALERADRSAASRLLYDASVSQGLARIPGTLAVSQRPGSVEATLTGPFGSPIARYEAGVLRGDRLRPLAIEPEELRALLAGVWRGEAPEVAGVRDGLALLRWEGMGRVEGVLDVEAGRLASLRIVRPQGELVARYSGRWDPWPQRIELHEGSSGSKVRLSLIGLEPL